MVDTIITDLGVLAIGKHGSNGMKLTKSVLGVSIDEAEVETSTDLQQVVLVPLVQ